MYSNACARLELSARTGTTGTPARRIHHVLILRIVVRTIIGDSTEDLVGTCFDEKSSTPKSKSDREILDLTPQQYVPLREVLSWIRSCTVDL